MEKRSRNFIDSSCANRQTRFEASFQTSNEQTAVDRQRILRLKHFIKRDDKISQKVQILNHHESAQQQLKNKFNVQLNRGNSAELSKNQHNRSAMYSLDQLPNNSIYPGLEMGFRATREKFCISKQKSLKEQSVQAQAFQVPLIGSLEDLNIGQVSIHQSIIENQELEKPLTSKRAYGAANNWKSAKTMTGSKWRVKNTDTFLPREYLAKVEIPTPTISEAIPLGYWEDLLDASWILNGDEKTANEKNDSRGGTFYSTFTPKRLEQLIENDISHIESVEPNLLKGGFTILLKSKV